MSGSSGACRGCPSRTGRPRRLRPPAIGSPELRVIAPPLLHLQNIALTFGGTPLLEDAELAVGPGERACLVGRNGSGKSTLLKIAAGLVQPDRGTRFVQPGATIRYLPQEPDLSGFATTLAFVEAGLGPGDDPYRARYALERLGLTGTEEPSRLSGGEARCARAGAGASAGRAPARRADESSRPAGHRVARGRAQGPALGPGDDQPRRRFLETLSEATTWLDRGVTRRIERGFAHFEAWRNEILEEEERDRHKLDRKIAREEDWLRYGVTRGVPATSGGCARFTPCARRIASSVARPAPST
jgi:ABC transport system ATP-binding/permease protein